MPTWIVPTAIYVVLLGAMSVTSKLALRTIPWPDLIVWAAIGYAVTAVVLMASGHVALRVVPDTPWAIAAAAAAIAALIALYIALGTGEVSKVVPISAAYPAVALLLSAALLSEHITPLRWAGMVVVVAGVVMLTISP